MRGGRRGRSRVRLGGHAFADGAQDPAAPHGAALRVEARMPWRVEHTAQTLEGEFDVDERVVRVDHIDLGQGQLIERARAFDQDLSSVRIMLTDDHIGEHDLLEGEALLILEPFVFAAVDLAGALSFGEDAVEFAGLHAMCEAVELELQDEELARFDALDGEPGSELGAEGIDCIARLVEAVAAVQERQDAQSLTSLVSEASANAPAFDSLDTFQNTIHGVLRFGVEFVRNFCIT